MFSIIKRSTTTFNFDMYMYIKYLTNKTYIQPPRLRRHIETNYQLQYSRNSCYFASLLTSLCLPCVCEPSQATLGILDIQIFKWVVCRRCEGLPSPHWMARPGLCLNIPRFSYPLGLQSSHHDIALLHNTHAAPTQVDTHTFYSTFIRFEAVGTMREVTNDRSVELPGYRILRRRLPGGRRSCRARSS